MLTVKEIRKYLPHRYPFMLVDRILEMDTESHIIGLKNVSANEPFFNGHFPEEPIMPGVLIVEALAQVAGILAVEKIKQDTGQLKVFVLASLDCTKFKTPVIPGDQLVMEAHIIAHKRNFWKFKCVAKVGDKVAVQTEILMSEREPF